MGFHVKAKFDYYCSEDCINPTTSIYDDLIDMPITRCISVVDTNMTLCNGGQLDQDALS